MSTVHPASSSPENVCEAQARAAKEELRRTLLKRRRSQSPELAAGRSIAAQERLLSSPCWKESQVLALYVGVRDEMPTRLLLENAWSSGRDVWLPRVRTGGFGSMDFVRCTGYQDLAPGVFGLLEPRKELPALSASDPGFQPQLLLVPGLAFDRQGNRLGYGGGYYDRFLDALAAKGHYPMLGFCFSFQIVAQLPYTAWDRPVNGFCTEGELLWISH